MEFGRKSEPQRADPRAGQMGVALMRHQVPAGVAFVKAPDVHDGAETAPFLESTDLAANAAVLVETTDAGTPAN